MNRTLLVLGVAASIPRENDNTALIPELWARETLATLMSNTVMASLVHRDYSSAIASYGDVVNAHRPANFKGKRKTDSDNVVTQDAISNNIRVPLDQHVHVSFVLKDGELSKALPDLLHLYMKPAAIELAEKIDQIIAGQSARLLSNAVGRRTEISELNADSFVLDADEKLNDNKVPKAGRYLVLSTKANRACLGTELFVSSEKRGDEGTALRNASLGRVYNFDSFVDQNIPTVKPEKLDSAAGATGAAYTAGHTGNILTTVAFASTAVGDYVRFAGHTKVYRIATTTNATGAATLTLTEALESDIADETAVVVTQSGAVNNASGYAAGWVKEIAVDGHTSGKGPQIGQLVTFGTGSSSHTYSIIDVTETSGTASLILLDRPLEANVSDDAAAFYGPAGSANLAFTRDAIAFVNRPLALPPAGSGALSAVTNFDNLSLRVVMQYDGESQGMRVTFDLLCGVAILDERQACVVYG